MEPAIVLLWIAIVTFGVGLILFVIGLFMPKGTQLDGEFDWGKWFRDQFAKTFAILTDTNRPRADRVNAAGLLLMYLGIIIILVAVSVGLATGTWPTPDPSTTTPAPGSS